MTVFRHVVMWQVDATAAGTREENSRALAATLRTMDGAIDGLLNLEIRHDERGAAGNADVVMIADFRDLRAFERYDQDPAHLVVARWISGRDGMARMAVDFTTETA